MIFYRLSRPLIVNAHLPKLNLSDYHVESKDHIYKLKITPETKLDKNCILINYYQHHYNQNLESITQYGTKYDAEICQALNDFFNKYDLDLPILVDYNIRLSYLEFSNPELCALSADEIEPRINAIYTFNISFLKLIKYVISDRKITNYLITDNPKSKTLAQLFMECKHMVLK